MATWPFEDPPNTATITVRQIVHGSDPILLVVRDADDCGWQFLSGGAFDVDDGMVVSLQSMLNRDPSLTEVADLAPGWQATRDRAHAPWQRCLTSE